VRRYDGPAALEGASEAGDRDIGGQRPDTPSARPAQLARDAATAAGWGDRPPPQRIALRRSRPMHRATLRGFIEVELPNALVVRKVAIQEKAGKWWASLPSKPVLDRDGRHKTDPTGRRADAAALEWRSRELGDRFSQVVVTVLRQMYSDAFDEAGP